MEPLEVFAIIGLIWLVVYFVAQWIGVEKLSEKGIDAGFPFFIMWRTQRLNTFLTRMGKKFPRVFFNIGIVVGFGGMIVSFVMFGDNLIKFFVQPEAAGGVVPIIPGVTITGLPLVYMLIGLAVTLLTHEFAHGLAASKDGIAIKSSGLLAFLVLFGGFVEPDQEQFENEATPQSRMRLLAAGSFANFAWGFVFLIILANFYPLMSIGYYPPNGAYVYDLEAGSPAAAALDIGTVITGLNDTEIANWTAVSRFMLDAPAGAQLTIHTLNGSEVTIILAASKLNESRGYMGIFGSDYWEPRPGWDVFLSPMFVFHLQQIIFWCYLILISIALFNLLPIPVFDGDKLLSNGLSLVIKDEKKIKYIMWPVRIAALGIVLLSIILSFIMGKGLF
ncbi:MAG: site-2 protease family protein [Candidatus Thorarchaeota archaeon]|nr:site-2 protease family protein [Candidatus Thorarchaeota archaeon]